MLTVAYLANEFPSAVEPYVIEEIEELQKRGIRIVAGSVLRKKGIPGVRCVPEVILLPPKLAVTLSALWLCLLRWRRLVPLAGRVFVHGREGIGQRIRALIHTFLGACYAASLTGRDVDHIHAHHGYLGSWIAMTAAQLLDIGFSVTLHGSDLLLQGAYLDLKLKQCSFCLTISEYNKQFILDRCPGIDPGKVVVSRLGVEVPEALGLSDLRDRGERFTLLAVGRLHVVKDHAFLVRACARLASIGVDVECFIAGDGPERNRLQELIQELQLEDTVTLLGHVAREQMDSLYARANVVVLTSRSEGIPLVLMEAMARSKIVVAPAITGIPELVIGGKTGLLYEPGSMQDLVRRLLFIDSTLKGKTGGTHPGVDQNALRLDWIRHAAHIHVQHNFNRRISLECFADLFLQRTVARIKALSDEDLVLQQI